jgi:hypothetical protein
LGSNLGSNIKYNASRVNWMLKNNRFAGISQIDFNRTFVWEFALEMLGLALIASDEAVDNTLDAFKSDEEFYAALAAFKKTKAN